MGEVRMKGITMDMVVIELATELGRHRALRDRESRWLERALRREDRRNGRQTKPWKQDEPKLKRMLSRGMRPAQIAIRLNRTPRAIYRKMYKLGLRCGNGSVALASDTTVG